MSQGPVRLGAFTKCKVSPSTLVYEVIENCGMSCQGPEVERGRGRVGGKTGRGGRGMLRDGGREAGFGGLEKGSGGLAGDSAGGGRGSGGRGVQ